MARGNFSDSAPRGGLRNVNRPHERESIFSPSRYHRLPKLGDKVTKHFEFDARPLFNSQSGHFFKSECVIHGWEKLWGGDDWWFSADLCNDFKRNVQFTEDDMYYVDTSKRKPRRVLINRKYLSDLTGVPLNENFEWETFLDFLNGNLLDLLDDVAPYRNKAIGAQGGHYHGARLLMTGLQENQVLFAKWFTVNVLGGGNNRHELGGPAAWVLKHVMYDTLPPGFCILQVLLSTLRQAKCGNTKSLPLPYLMTCIVAKEKNIKMTVNDYPMKPIQAKRALKCDIPGFWQGEVLPESHPLRPRPLYSDDDWVEWTRVARVKNPGGGRSYRDTFISVTSAVGTVHSTDPPPSRIARRARTFTEPSLGEGHIGSSSSAPRASVPPVVPLTGYLPTGHPPYRGVPYVTFENFHEAGFIHQIPIADRMAFLADSLALHHARLSRDPATSETPTSYASFGFDFDGRSAFHASLLSATAGATSSGHIPPATTGGDNVMGDIGDEEEGDDNDETGEDMEEDEVPDSDDSPTF